MTIAEHDHGLPQHLTEFIDSTTEPWVHWLSRIEAAREEFARYVPEHTPRSNVEFEVNCLIGAADTKRLALVPTTQHFAVMWQTFRRHHEELDSRGKYRRLRWSVWESAALKVMLERARFQNAVDAKEARDKFEEAMLGPEFTVQREPSPLSEYAGVVLILIKRVV
jgi:hypothetical protein